MVSNGSVVRCRAAGGGAAAAATSPASRVRWLGGGEGGIGGGGGDIAGAGVAGPAMPESG